MRLLLTMYGSVKNERSRERERERENVLKRNVVMENRKREIKDGNDVGRYR